MSSKEETMKARTVIFVLFLVVGGLLFLASRQTAQATSPEDLALISEMTGMVASDTSPNASCQFSHEFQVYLCPQAVPTILPVPDPAARASALDILQGGGGLLLIPDSTNRRVMAFDAITGDLVDANFVPADTTNLTTPIEAIVGPAGQILVSDQVRDWVFAYDLSGAPIGMYAGGNTAILDNIRGIALQANGNLLVSVGGGANSNAIAEFDTTGTSVGNFVAVGSGGLNSPFDVYGRVSDWLVPAITSDAVHRYDLSGAFIANLTPVDTFPEQVAEAGNGNVLVANFSPSAQEGVLEYTSTGTFVGRYDPAPLTGYRGVYELPNGNFLTTTGTGVHEISRAGTLVSTKISGVSGRFITFFAPASAALGKTVGTTPATCAATSDITVATGTDVYYCLTITNTGAVTLTNHTISDPILGVQTTIPYALAPGASVSLTEADIPALGPVAATANIVNTAAITATNGTFTATNTSLATVTTVGVGIAVTKTVGLTDTACTGTTISVGLGTPVYYCVTVQNQSEITVTNVAISDPLLGYTFSTSDPQPPGAILDIVGIGPYTPTTTITNTVYVTATTDVGDTYGNASAVVLPAPTDVVLTEFGGQRNGMVAWVAAAFLLTSLFFIVRRRGRA
jgi:hypothetical protein